MTASVSGFHGGDLGALHRFDLDRGEVGHGEVLCAGAARDRGDVAGAWPAQETTLQVSLVPKSYALALATPDTPKAEMANALVTIALIFIGYNPRRKNLFRSSFRCFGQRL